MRLGLSNWLWLRLSRSWLGLSRAGSGLGLRRQGDSGLGGLLLLVVLDRGLDWLGLAKNKESQD